MVEEEYCEQLIFIIKGNEELCSYLKVQRKLNLLEEATTDDKDYFKNLKDEDARVEHKTHIAVKEEQIITVATITNDEKTHDKELLELI